MKERLHLNDITFLKGKLRQRIVIAIMSIMIAFIFFIIPFSLASSTFGRIALTAVFIVGMVLTFLSITQKARADLSSGYKTVYTTCLKDKVTNARYGWTGNPLVDWRRNSVLIEYKFIFADFELFVEEEVYEKFAEGDVLALSFSSFTNKLIGISESPKDEKG